MTISSLTLFKVAVPLKKVVRHASFERSVSENLVVRVTLPTARRLWRRGPAVVCDRRDVGIDLRGPRSARLGPVVGRPATFAEVVGRMKR